MSTLHVCLQKTLNIKPWTHWYNLQRIGNNFPVLISDLCSLEIFVCNLQELHPLEAQTGLQVTHDSCKFVAHGFGLSMRCRVCSGELYIGISLCSEFSLTWTISRGAYNRLKKRWRNLHTSELCAKQLVIITKKPKRKSAKFCSQSLGRS